MRTGPGGRRHRHRRLAAVLLLGVAVHFSMALQLQQLLLRRQHLPRGATAAASFLKPPLLAGAASSRASAAFSRAARPLLPLEVNSRRRGQQQQQRRFASAAAGGGHDGELYDLVEETLKGPCGVTQGGSRLVVAVSGGSDSVALLHLLAGVRGRWQPPLALRVAHFNHGLRLPEADEEEAFVRRLGGDLDVPVHVFRWGDADRARAAGIQARSRAWRRAECRRLLLEQGPGEGFVATAHQADDQMETWALKLLRGAHLSHLRGMAYCARDGAEQEEEAEADELEEEVEEDEDSSPAAAASSSASSSSSAAASSASTAMVTSIKPLLDVPKARLAHFLAARGLEWREDASNAVADKYKRNRVRLQLLPLMAELAGGEAALRARVGALSAQSEALDEWLAEAAAAWEAGRQAEAQTHRLRPHELWVGGGRGTLTSGALPRLVQEEVVHRFVARATGGALRALPYAQVARVLRRLARDAAADAGGSGAGIAWRLFLAQGWVLDRQGQVLRVSREAAAPGADGAAAGAEGAAAAVASFPDAGLELVGLPLGWQAAVERLPPGAAAEEEAAEAEGALVLHGLPHGTRLRCRRRRDGDRFHPAWRPGPVKLKDFLRGQRVPLHRRDEVLLLCLEEEEEAGAEVVVALVDPPFVARPFCGGAESSSEPGAAALALRIAPEE